MDDGKHHIILEIEQRQKSYERLHKKYDKSIVKEFKTFVKYIMKNPTTPYSVETMLLNETFVKEINEIHYYFDILQNNGYVFVYDSICSDDYFKCSAGFAYTIETNKPVITLKCPDYSLEHLTILANHKYRVCEIL